MPDDSPIDAPLPEPPGPPAKAGTRGRHSLGTIELASLAVFGVLLIAGVALFFKFSRGIKRIAPKEIARSFTVPVKGTAAVLSSVTTAWRDRIPEDRAKPGYEFLPEARITLDPASSGTGWLRLSFLDGGGELRGDPVMLKVEGGKFKDTGRGGKTTGIEAIMPATEGFHTKSEFQSRQRNMEPAWSLRIEEGKDYATGPWHELGHAQLSAPE